MRAFFRLSPGLLVLGVALAGCTPASGPAPPNGGGATTAPAAAPATAGGSTAEPTSPGAAAGQVTLEIGDMH